MTKQYTVVPLESLDTARSELHRKLTELTKVTGTKYKVRTFYLGPRGKAGAFGSRPRSALKSAAVAAKLGVYEDRYYGYELAYYV